MSAIQDHNYARQILIAVNNLKNEIGPKCDFNLSIYSQASLSSNDRPVWWSLQPEGYHDVYDKTWRMSGSASSFEEAISVARMQWQEQVEARDASKVQEMALAIIRLTVERDECTDVMLRAEPGFDQAMVERLGERAMERANHMASKGPFVIKFLKASSNGAPADVDNDIPF